MVVLFYIFLFFNYLRLFKFCIMYGYFIFYFGMLIFRYLKFDLQLGFLSFCLVFKVVRWLQMVFRQNGKMCVYQIIWQRCCLDGLGYQFCGDQLNCVFSFCNEIYIRLNFDMLVSILLIFLMFFEGRFVIKVRKMRR